MRIEGEAMARGGIHLFHRMQSRDQVCGRRGEHKRDDLVGQVVTCSLLVKTNPLLGDLIYHRSRV
jgi:hypothetical protein